ncbi:hypothetical protein [Roseibium sp. M-1]
MSSSETVDDADYEVSQSNSDEALNATVLIPDTSSSSSDETTLTKDNSSFLRIGQYDASEEGERSPDHMDAAARGALIQTTGGLFFLVGEDAYHQYKTNLDIYVEGNLTEAIDGNSSTTISGTNDVKTTGLSRHSGESYVISTGSYTDVDPGSTKDILLKSNNHVKAESDSGVKLTVGSSYYVELDSSGLWQTQLKDAIDVTTGTTHSRFGGWNTEEFYGGSFEFQIAGAIAISFSVTIEIALLVGISVASIEIGATGIGIGATNIDIAATNIKIEKTMVEVANTAVEVTTKEAEVKDVSAVLNSVGIKIASGMNIIT